MLDERIKRRCHLSSSQVEQVLSNTYGSIVYQEQILMPGHHDYSLGEADLLRRAMGKKDIAEMDRQKIIFVERAVKNEVREDIASEIFDLMAYLPAMDLTKAIRRYIEISIKLRGSAHLDLSIWLH